MNGNTGTSHRSHAGGYSIPFTCEKLEHQVPPAQLESVKQITAQPRKHHPLDRQRDRTHLDKPDQQRKPGSQHHLLQQCHHRLPDAGNSLPAAPATNLWTRGLHPPTHQPGLALPRPLHPVPKKSQTTRRSGTAPRLRSAPHPHRLHRPQGLRRRRVEGQEAWRRVLTPTK